jgi:hypothetical protein
MDMNRKEENLDPKDWEAMRSLAHEMVDDALEFFSTARTASSRRGGTSLRGF